MTSTCEAPSSLSAWDELQQRVIRQVHDDMIDHRRVCLTLPTGGGKTLVACHLIRDWLVAGMKVSVYTNRKMLIDQLSRVMSEFGLGHGKRAAGHEESHGEPLQISSIQTEASRVLRKKKWQLHEADRVIFDECHLFGGKQAQEVQRLHMAQGASCLGLTATPIDLGHMYDHLIVGATNSELRECGALVPALHYGPDEPDCSKIRKQPWQYTEGDIKKIINVQHIFGRVLTWWEKLNPTQKPTMLFASGVAESMWFCENLCKRGINAAHIDGDECWVDGKVHSSKGQGGRDIRQEIMDRHRDGDIKILCNRFVLREGIDAPWCEHIILATVIGTVQSYLQTCGRGLRSAEGKTHCIIQDHGGHWHRAGMGSLNANRFWRLDFTENMVQGLAAEKLRNKEEAEPVRCPQCAKIMMTSLCSCGYRITRKSRPVMQIDGTLKEMGGDIYRPRVTDNRPDTEKLLEACYFRAKKSGMTFNQMEGLFLIENGYYPPRTLPYMPVADIDYYRRVSEVDRSRLNQKA